MAHDPELARKSKLSREQQVEALRTKARESRAATDSYRHASAENVARLNDLMPSSKAKAEAATQRRKEVVNRLCVIVGVPVI